jgi:TRAP-type C4-dicarboxylate transport system permease small subunit
LLGAGADAGIRAWRVAQERSRLMMPPSAADRPGFLRALSAINTFLLLICKWVAIGLVAAIAIIVCASVIFRYGFNNSLAWAEDAAKFLLVWLAFVGSPLGFKHGAHVAIDFVPAAVPAVVRRLVRALTHLIVLVLMVVLVWQGWKFALNGWSQVALTIGDISMFWIFLCMPIGAAIMALVALELLVLTLLGYPEPSIGEDESITTQGL